MGQEEVKMLKIYIENLEERLVEKEEEASEARKENEQWIKEY